MIMGLKERESKKQNLFIYLLDKTIKAMMGREGKKLTKLNETLMIGIHFDSLRYLICTHLILLLSFFLILLILF